MTLLPLAVTLWCALALGFLCGWIARNSVEE
jgi:hypothetical protein